MYILVLVDWPPQMFSWGVFHVHSTQPNFQCLATSECPDVLSIYPVRWTEGELGKPSPGHVLFVPPAPRPWYIRNQSCTSQCAVSEFPWHVCCFPFTTCPVVLGDSQNVLETEVLGLECTGCFQRQRQPAGFCSAVFWDVNFASLGWGPGLGRSALLQATDKLWSCFMVVDWNSVPSHPRSLALPVVDLSVKAFHHFQCLHVCFVGSRERPSQKLPSRCHIFF